MGKQKGEGLRSKNRPSSSSLSASLVPLGASSVGFGGYLGSSKIESSSSTEEYPSFLNVDNEVAQHLKRLGRKDPTTKVKALTALCSLFKQKSSEEVVQIVPQWAYEYKRLLLDYNREVRLATHDTMAAFVAVVRKGLAPYLKSLMGPWWFAQFDPIPEVSQAARFSFEVAFPAPEKRLDVLILCVDSIFVYLDENLKLTPNVMSDKATPMDELEDMHHRVISCSLTAIATLIDVLLKKEIETSSENITTEQKLASRARITVTSAAEKLFSVHNFFLDFFKHKNPAVRSATYSVLTIYIKKIPHAYNEVNMKSLSAAILGAFQEKDISCHSSMWDMILLFSRRFPDVWLSKSTRNTALNELWKFLRNGCYGSKKVSYPALVILLESVPPKAVNGEQFLLLFFQSFWAGRNPSHSAADNSSFFKAFQECFLWVLDNVSRFSKSEADRSPLSIKLVNTILVMRLWYDYLPVNSKIDGESSLKMTTGVEDDPLSNEKLAEAQNYSSSYIQELGRCIINILTHISFKEPSLLHDFYATFFKDCLAVLQQRIFSKIIQEYMERIIDFIFLLGQLPLQKGQTWPWEFLIGPLIASSFTTIKTLDSIDAVELLSVLIRTFGPVTVLSHIHVCNTERCNHSSTIKGDDNDFRGEKFLQTFRDDFVPWCLQNHTSSSSAKLDLLLSLILDEYLSDQWSAIIEHFAKLCKLCVSDSDTLHHHDKLQSFSVLFEKLRAKVRLMITENVRTAGVLPEHWHHELLDSSAISIVYEATLFSSSHAQLLRVILGGSGEDDKICFLSRAAVTTIFQEILKILVLYLNKSSFNWARHSCSSLLSLASLDLTVSQKSFENVEIVQFAFQVLEGSFFCMKILDENGALISSILAALFIIDWECSISSLTDDKDHSENYHRTEGIQILRDSQTNTDHHLTEKIDAKLALKKQIYSFHDSLRTRFSSIVSLCDSSELRNILIQTIRSCVSETGKLSSDVISSLCSSWAIDLLEITCQEYNQFQCMLDLLLYEAESWPLWVTPLLEDGRRTATLRCMRASDEINELSHGNFLALADKLISNLGVQKVIVGCTEEIPADSAPNSLHPYSRAWLAVEFLCTWNWKEGNALSSLIAFLSKHTNDENPTNKVTIISSLVKILFDGALIHGTHNPWIVFCSWITSDDAVENIEDPFLRALIFLLHNFIVKDNIWGRLETDDFIKHVLDKLFLNGSVNRDCLRILPYVLSFIVRSLVFQRTEFDESTEDASFVPFESVELYDNIINWLEIAAAFPPLHSLETGSNEALAWIQAVLACFPLSSREGMGELKVEVLRNISEMEKKILLSLFRKQRSAATVSAVPSSSTSTFAIPMKAEMIIAKLTAIIVAYCWDELVEEDWSFVITKLLKWLEPSVLLLEELAENVDDDFTSNTPYDTEFILKKLKQVVQQFDPLSASLSSTSLVTFSLLSDVLERQKADSLEDLQSIKHGNWLQVKDQILQNVLRLFFTTGVVEAIAKSCSEEASSIIALSRVDYSLFWSLIASSAINTPENARSKAVESMERWGLSKGPISSLYAILFSSIPISSMRRAAFNFLSTKPIIHLSILKETFLESNGIASQEPYFFNTMDRIAEQTLCLREEISCFILKPTELSEMALTGHDRINVFLSWALMLAHLHSLPSSSTTRERLVQFIQDYVSSAILDCLFQHIPLKGVGTGVKKKATELSGVALLAANSAMNAISTGFLLLIMESLWPVETKGMASLAGAIYGMMVRLLPSYVRDWFTSLRDRSLSSAIEFFTKVWCSPPLLSDELSQVKETVLADENFSLNVNKSSYEIVATYKKEETGMDLVIRLPTCYPLKPVDVECTRSLGISEVKQRKWLLSLTAFVRNQNGAIAEAIRIWKSNFDKEFDGVEECPICYSIIHTTNHSLPRLACKTCKHKFHSACLYKWFSTSHKSTCPLCQTPF
ncbi:E3 ubiquitin-protein ligase listerin [Phalaenopsis equestris]|uniref:E3 ubiquitin-protein ligase listerin n=1 Tax=Phalaenopsis equestris TaxID=78828 RepID=UPI0009E637A7|nr:E3 ubiquitin-protein ligase listerin [Phalaenopsis equestris]